MLVLPLFLGQPYKVAKTRERVQIPTDLHDFLEARMLVPLSPRATIHEHRRPVFSLLIDVAFHEA